MDYKIQHVKDFVKNGIPQFDIIQRRDKGKSFEYGVINSDELDFEHKQTLFPPDNGEGIISIVKRISDDCLFHQGDMVEINKIGTCFIIEFKEDLVHCSVVDIADQLSYEMEINDLIWVLNIVADEGDCDESIDYLDDGLNNSAFGGLNASFDVDDQTTKEI